MAYKHKQPKSLLKIAAEAVGVNISHEALNMFKIWCTQSGNHIERNAALELPIVKSAEKYDAIIPKRNHDIVTCETLQYLAFKFKWLFERTREVSLYLKPRSKDDICEYDISKFDNYQLGIYEALCESFRNLESLNTYLNFLCVCVRSHVTKFSLFYWPVEMHDALLKTLPRLKHLRRLTIYEGNLSQNLTYIVGGIQEMKNLESFICRSCPDEILKVVCDNCPLIKLRVNYLRGSPSADVSDILKLQKLKELEISYISNESLLHILLGLPCLEAITCSILNSSLALIEDKNLKFGLKSVHYISRMNYDLINLTEYCPLLTKVNITGPERLNLSALVELKYLESLTTHFSDDIYTLLQSIGHQITELNINKLDVNILLEALSRIKTLCPNLRNLVLNTVNIGLYA